MTMTLCLRASRRPFLGTPDAVAAMRDWLAARLDASGLSTDNLTALAVLVASELATNAVKHTASGRPGGTYTAAFRWKGDRLWLAVADQGGTDAVPAAGELDLVATSGRGLTIIAALADEWGSRLLPGAGRCTWALLRLDSGQE